MMFVYIFIASFILGIYLAMPLAEYTLKKGVIVTYNAFLPFLILNFFAYKSPLISDIRYYFFALAFGMACYWAYYESIHKQDKKP